MTSSVQQLLDFFDGLPEPERYQAAMEIFHRVGKLPFEDISALALVEAADELFRTLDADECGHAH